MRSLLNSIAFMGILAIFQLSASAQIQGEMNSSYIEKSSGADIRGFTSSGEQFNGELLSVRKNSLMLLNSSACKDDTKWWECVDQVKKDDIQKVIIEGDSYVGWGFGIGTFLAVLSIPIMIDFNPNPEGFLNMPENRISVGATIGVVIGCILAGSIVGLIASTEDEVIEPFSEYDINGLSVYAKYPGGEPRILKQIEGPPNDD